MKIKKIMIDLSLFDGDGGGQSSGATSAESAPSVAGKGKGDYANVKFGKQEPAQPDVSAADSGVQVTSDTLEERRKAYNDLIRGEYKDFYTQDTQRMIDRRFAETKNLEKQVEEFKPLMDMLQQRYNTNDVASVIKALESDDAYWEQAAYDAGLSVEQYKKVQKLERENKELIEAQRHHEEQKVISQKVDSWLNEANSLKEQYPDFDFESELTNDKFSRLLTTLTDNGFPNPIQQAYEIVHMDELKNGIVQYTAKQTSKAVTDNIRARGMRPLENGVSSSPAFTVKSDVTKLTKKDRAEIARRVARGETISF